ncbi:MAG: SUMF1/EgtB/PvdO family nonheme iron enzyme, partial [Thermoguttaceae bacterium]
ASDPATPYYINGVLTFFGSVPYVYQMGKYDVTVGQYCQFLNSVATKSDPYGLYNTGMATDMPTFGIARNGSSGSYSYSVTGSYSQGVNCPIFDVSWGDAARFCNWLQNGQPTSGTEGTGTTETGAYNLITSSGTGATTTADLMAVTRSSTATYVIPSENEWYKAAYFDPTLNGGGGGYWGYPTKSNTPPINTLPDTGNHANFNDAYGTGNGGYTDATNYLTPVGSFVLSPGPYGTFDMGGDVWQWDESAVQSSYRVVRGGCWSYFSDYLGSSCRYMAAPTYEDEIGGPVGFRVASVPEPGSIALLLAGGFCLVAFAWRRRRKLA